MLCIFIKPNVRYWWSLKILVFKTWFPFNFENFTGPPFCGEWTKELKLLADISFESGLENIVLSNLLLFSCACYQVDLDDIQWNEEATSSAHNFNNSGLLYFNFSNMINFCPNIWFIENSKFKTQKKKLTAKKTLIFHFFKGPLFRNG